MRGAELGAQDGAPRRLRPGRVGPGGGVDGWGGKAEEPQQELHGEPLPLETPKWGDPLRKGEEDGGEVRWSRHVEGGSGVGERHEQTDILGGTRRLRVPHILLSESSIFIMDGSVSGGGGGV